MNAYAIHESYQRAVRNYLLQFICRCPNLEMYNTIRGAVGEVTTWFSTTQFEVVLLQTKCDDSNQPRQTEPWHTPQHIRVDVEVWFAVEPNTRYFTTFDILTYDVVIVGSGFDVPEPEEPEDAYERAMSIICTRSSSS